MVNAPKYIGGYPIRWYSERLTNKHFRAVIGGPHKHCFSGGSFSNRAGVGLLPPSEILGALWVAGGDLKAPGKPMLLTLGECSFRAATPRSITMPRMGLQI
jgi:hypothetical protein